MPLYCRLSQEEVFQSSSFLHIAMQRFMSSGASSSSSRVERPLSIPGSTSSAEKPAPSLRIAEQFATPAYVKILTIHDVQRWLAEESIASCTD